MPFDTFDSVSTMVTRLAARLTMVMGSIAWESRWEGAMGDL
jgi:hypothetical protein